MAISSEDHTLPAALAGLEKVFMSKMSNYMSSNRGFWSERLGFGGTLSNIESTVAWGGSLSYVPMNSGCVNVSLATFDALIRDTPIGWEISLITIGNVMEHHAVVVWLSEKNFDSGCVFDPWIEQEPNIYSYQQWRNSFSKIALLGEARLNQ